MENYRDMPQCTAEQQAIFDDVVACISGRTEVNVFYCDGPAGAGMTFLYRKLLHYLRGDGKIVLVVAFSGIAALLLDGGRTVHSRFRLPVPLPLEGAVANVSFNNSLAHLFRETSLIIWDEAPNAPKAAFDAVDRCLRDILDKAEKPFGGMPMLLGGDFRQVPPVLPRVEVEAIVSFTLRCCSFWDDFKYFKPTLGTLALHTNACAMYNTKNTIRML